MSGLSKIPNIGIVMARKLEQAGIRNIDDLKSMGSEKTFLLLKAVDKDACICSLYALEGAIGGIRWHDLPKEKKQELLHFFNECKKLG